jgi:hypothetical protein
VTQLRPQEAFLELVRYAYGVQRLDGVAGAPQFRTRSEIVQRVPTYRLSRPWNLGALRAVVDRVESQLESDA